MAFSNTNDYLTGAKPVPTPTGGDVVATRFSLALKTTDLALNTVGAVGVLPANCLPVAVLLDSDDLDSGTAAAMSVGILDSAGTDISTAAADGGAAWGASITVAQAGGQAQVLSKAISRVQPSNHDRKVGIKVTTAAGTAVAGEVGITLLYRAV